MWENDTMDAASTEVMSIRRRNDIENSTWASHRLKFTGFESRIHVDISTLNRFHDFLVDSSFKIHVFLRNFPVWISISNRLESTEMCPLGYCSEQLVLDNSSGWEFWKEILIFYMLTQFPLMRSIVLLR